MFRRSEVKWIRGITANDSCKLRITWLKTSKPCVDSLSPARAIVRTAGIKRHRPGDQAAEPGGDLEVEIPLHDDLARPACP